MEQEKYLPELLAEKDSLDPSFVHAMRLLADEIEKFQGSEGKKEDEEKKYLDVISNKNIKLAERVLIPVKQYPKFNFVGKLLGPRGNSLKRLQEETGAKMSILGKGSMRDKAKEEELRRSGEAKFAHLSDELHVLIEVFAPPGEAYSRMSHALEEIKKFLVPDYNDEIRQEQLRELSYLNGSEDAARGRALRGRGLRVPPAAPARGRGGAIPPPPPGRGAQAPRGAPVSRGALPVPPVARGVPAPRARGAPAVPGYRPPLPPAHQAYEDYGYDDGYGGDYEDPSYEAYDSSYATPAHSVPDYYDYGPGASEEAYGSYAPEEWATTRSSLKAPPARGWSAGELSSRSAGSCQGCGALGGAVPSECCPRRACSTAGSSSVGPCTALSPAPAIATLSGTCQHLALQWSPAPQVQSTSWCAPGLFPG